ncbi:MAG: DNA repair exonuclease [Spirochaetales bacterium]|nr:DNA repair exonuclease [Spirochaetales bacterium]
MKLLITADIHMGRIPSVGELPGLTGVSAWKKVVDAAIEHDVDALILVGDVVDDDDLWFSVYGHILDGLDRLDEAGIRVFGVAGNHDSAVFARLSVDFPSLTILGRGGSWERVEFDGIELVGWSFPQSTVTGNPFDRFVKTDSSKLSLGLLHTDLGGGRSGYAPTRIDDFTNSGVDLWMLGHIHKPGKVDSAEVYYCGSPFGLDRNETGAHGAYLVTSENRIRWDRIERIELAPYRFESVTVELQNEENRDEVRRRITGELRELTREADRTLFIRLNLRGVVDQRLLGRDLLEGDERYIALFTLPNGTIYLDRVYDHETMPPLDLEEIARGSGPAALLAKKILDPDSMRRLAESYGELEKASYRAGAYQPLTASYGDEEEALKIAKEQALLVLQSLMNQVEGTR